MLSSPGDQKLSEAIAAGRVVLGMPLSDPGAEPDAKAGFAIAGDNPQAFLPQFSGAILPLKSMRDGALGLAAMNFIPDRDLVVRELPTVFNVNGRLVPSIAAEALRIARMRRPLSSVQAHASGETEFGERAGVTAIKVRQRSRARLPVGVHSYSLRRRAVLTAKSLRGKSLRARSARTIEGKIVLIGATASALYDLRATPLDNAVPGCAHPR